MFMIISEILDVTVNYLNINHYISIGYSNIKCNQKLKVPVYHLPNESNCKVLVKCDVCDNQKLLSYQKYKKNINKYNIYTCNTSCAQFKNRLTLKNKYGSFNFNRSEENRLKIKDKYDGLTKNIESLGYIECSKCGIKNDISLYLKNLNGRYKKVCRYCRSKQNSDNRRLRDMSSFYKKYYRDNIHIYSWRNLLKNYLNRKSLIKVDKTIKMLGYSHIDLRNHLESLFVDDMSWDNYGIKWQIDHIIPVSHFRADTSVNIVNSLENLRPVYKEYNNIKGNNLDDASILILDKYKTYLKITI